MHVFLFERNLNFFHEFVPAAQISLARSALFFRRLLPCIVDYLSFLRLRTLASDRWTLYQQRWPVRERPIWSTSLSMLETGHKRFPGDNLRTGKPFETPTCAS